MPLFRCHNCLRDLPIELFAPIVGSYGRCRDCGQAHVDLARCHCGAPLVLFLADGYDVVMERCAVNQKHIHRIQLVIE